MVDADKYDPQSEITALANIIAKMDEANRLRNEILGFILGFLTNTVDVLERRVAKLEMAYKGEHPGARLDFYVDVDGGADDISGGENG